MKALFDIKRFKFYAWVGLACFTLGVLVDVGQHPSEIGRRLLDNLWLCSYLTVLNYVLLEYTLPRLRWKKFFSSLLLIILHLILYPGGTGLWIRIGAALKIYTVFESMDASDRMA